MKRTAIVMVIEGLGTNMLGSYGGPWIGTPNLDAFASRSIVADQFWADSDSMDTLYRSMLFGWHAAESPRRIGNSIPSILDLAGESALFVHDAQVGLQLPKSEFQETIEVPQSNCEEADEWEETSLARWLAVALDEWSQAESPSLLWLHSQGWNGPWDAPYRYRESLCDEEDPTPPRGIQPPTPHVRDEIDPDLLFGWTQAAAAQAKVLDRAWEWIELLLQNRGRSEECMVLLCGAHGYPLGEHGTLGVSLSAPFAELIHLPCVIRPHDHQPLGNRRGDLRQTPDLWRTLIDWFRLEERIPFDEPSRRLSNSLLQPIREGNPKLLLPAFCSGVHGQALRVGPWGAVWEKTHDPTQPAKPLESKEVPSGEDNFASDDALPRLYLHPEDRWQQNNVVSRAQDVASDIVRYRRSLIQWYASDDPVDAIPSIPESLSVTPT